MLRLTAHNAFANKDDGWVYAQQTINIVDMFKFGVRSFMIDICEHDKELYLCHGDYTPSRLQQLGKQPRLLKNLFEDINILLTNNQLRTGRRLLQQ